MTKQGNGAQRVGQALLTKVARENHLVELVARLSEQEALTLMFECAKAAEDVQEFAANLLEELEDTLAYDAAQGAGTVPFDQAMAEIEQQEER